MFFSWYELAMLAFESNSVIGLRCSKILRGGEASLREMHLMGEEKVLAGSEACAALAKGVTANGIVEFYRSKVASNETRLSASAS